MKVLLPAIVLLVMFFCSGCVSPETAAKYEAARVEVLQLQADIKELKRQYESGELAAKDVAPKLVILESQLRSALDKLEAYAKADESWLDKAGYILMSILGVAVARKLNIPGLASGTRPLNFTAPK